MYEYLSGKKYLCQQKKREMEWNRERKKALKIQFGQSIFGILPKFLLKGHFLSFVFIKKKYYTYVFYFYLRKIMLINVSKVFNRKTNVKFWIILNIIYDIQISPKFRGFTNILSCIIPIIMYGVRANAPLVVCFSS